MAKTLKWSSYSDGVYSSTQTAVPSIPDSMDIPDFMFNYRPSWRSDPKTATWYIHHQTGAKLSYSDCLNRTNALSKALYNEYGVEKNDVVLIFSPNSQDFATCCWAAMQLGACISAANPSYLAGELAYQISTVSKVHKVKAMITHPLSLATAKDAAKQAGLDERLICLMEDPPTKQGTVTLNELIEKHRKSKEFTRYRMAKGEAKTKIAFLSFSSGTTGLPKAVMISHYNVIANVLQYNSFRKGRFQPNVSRCLAVLPFYHIYGLVVVLHSQIFAGVTLIVLPKFDLKQFLSLTVQHKIDIHFIVPPMAVMLVKSPEAQKADLSSMKEIMIGAAPLGKDILNALREKVPKAAIGQGYGMTETATVVTSAPSSQVEKDFPAGSCGIILPNVQLMILDPEGKKQPHGKVGELVVKSPSNTLGYLNNKTATDDTFRDGWVHTGDEAYIDEKVGACFITDRIKELIKTKGMQVAPAELEGLLLGHPDVEDVCVVGIQHEMDGEQPKAFVVLTQAAQTAIGQDAEKKRVKQVDISDFVKEKTIRYKHLTGGVEFIDAIPKNPSGKLLRRILRDRANTKAKL